MRGDDESDLEDSPALDFGLKLGMPLALVALAWAFVGPAHLLELGRYEWPVVASFVEPFPYGYFGYLAALTFAVALVGGVGLSARTLALLVLAVGSAPLWLAALAGAGLGRGIRGVGA